MSDIQTIAHLTVKTTIALPCVKDNISSRKTMYKYSYASNQSPHSDYVTRCYFNLCIQQGSRDDRVSRDVLSFLYYSTLYSVQYGEILLS